MKKILCGMVFGIMIIAASVQAEVVDRIVAVVNGEIITYQELQSKFRELVTRSNQQIPSDPATLQKAHGQFLEDLINDLLLRQEAQRLKIEVSDTELENEIKQFKMRRRLNDDEFKRSLSMQGMTQEQFKDRTRQEIMKQRMIGYMVRRKVVVTDEEVAAYYEKHGRDFTAERTVDLQLLVVQDRETAQSLRKSIVGGDSSFGDAVTKNSIGPKIDGGTFTAVKWKELADPWRDALRKMANGDVSQPFELEGKWMVLKLLNQKDGAQQDLSEVKDEVREEIMRPKLEERFMEYMTGLRSKAVIDRRL